MNQLPKTTPTAALDGIAIKLGGATYILPPCSLATLKRHAKGIDAFSNGGGSFQLTPESVDLILAVITESLVRNYPTMTEEIVAEHVGVDTMIELFQAAMDVSGLIRKSYQAKASSTAAQEGGTLGESTGTASPLTS